MGAMSLDGLRLVYPLVIAICLALLTNAGKCALYLYILYINHVYIYIYICIFSVNVNTRDTNHAWASVPIFDCWKVVPETKKDLLWDGNSTPWCKLINTHNRTQKTLIDVCIFIIHARIIPIIKHQQQKQRLCSHLLLQLSTKHYV